MEEGLISADHEALGYQITETPQPGSDEDGTDGTHKDTREEIEAGTVKLESLLNQALDKNFDKLEIYTLRNLLTVSNLKEDEGLEDWIVLDHYKNVKTSELTENGPTPQSVEMLKRKLQETSKLQSVLRAEAVRNEEVLSKLRPLVGSRTKPSRDSLSLQSSSPTKKMDQSSQQSFSFLTATSPQTGSNLPLAPNTQFTLSQLPALRSLMAELRPHVSSVPRATDSEAAETRQKYIETQSRKAVKRRLGENEVSEGANVESLGRRIDKEEVRAMERFVHVMGENSDGGGRDDRMEE